MPRPRSLTRAGIAGAALSGIDRDGLAGLSMRTLATELGLSAMALYRYVDDRDQLEKWIVENVLGAVDLTAPPEASWNTRVILLMERIRDAVAAHTAAVPLFLAHRHTSSASLRWIETMLGVLTEAGFTGAQRVIAQRSLVSYLLGAVQVEHLSSLSGAGTNTMAALSSTDFPHVAEIASHAQHITAREEFCLGLTALLRGLQTESM